MPSSSLLVQVIPEKINSLPDSCQHCVDFNGSYFRLIKLNLNQVIFLNVYGLT